MNELGISLVWLAGQITLLCGVTAVIYQIARRRHPAAGATAALSGVLLSVVLTLGVFSPWPRWSLNSRPKATVTQSVPGSPPQPRVDDSSVPVDSKRVAAASGAGVDPAVDGELESTSSAAWSAFWRSLGRELAAPTPQAVDTGLRWPGWLAVSLLLAMALGAVRLLAGWITVRRCLRRSALNDDRSLRETVDVMRAALSCNREVALRESGEVASAATVGWRKPVVLLPRDWRDWSDGERRAVLAHELAHVSAGDAASWLAAQVGLLLHFYHPLVHWLTHRLRLEQELAADARAARLTGSSQMYLTTLAELAVRQPARRLAWPARAFLPTHGTLLRRIEMLRDTKAPPLRSSSFRRGTVITLTLAAALFAAGLRPPASQQALAQQRAKPQAAEEPTGFNLENVPASTTMLMGIHPAEIADRPELQQLGSMLAPLLQPEKSGLHVENIDQFLIFGMQRPKDRRDDDVKVLIPRDVPSDPVGAPVMEIRMTDATDFSKLIEQFRFLEVTEYPVTEVQRGRMSALRVKGDQKGGAPSPNDQVALRADDRTLLIGRPSELTSVLNAKHDTNERPEWLDRVGALSKDHACLMWDVAAFRPIFQRQMDQNPNPFRGMFVPLLENAELAIAGAQFDDRHTVTVTVSSRDADSAAKVEQTLRSLIPAGQALLAGLKASAQPSEDEFQNTLLQSIEFLESALKNVDIERADDRVTMNFEGDGLSLATLTAVTLPALQQAREAARRTQSRNNLKRIGLAFHNYHDVLLHFPTPVLIGPDGKTKYSWRIEVLPLLDQFDLYRQYDRTQPWDSEHNLKVLEQMPDVFRSPNDDPGSTNAAYYVLVGPHTAAGDKSVAGTEIRDVAAGRQGTHLVFEQTGVETPPGAGVSLPDISDGTSNTILVVEAKRDIPWTKPEDIPYSADEELPTFGGFHQPGFHALLADGSVQYIADTIDETTLRALITRDGGEVVNLR